MDKKELEKEYGKLWTTKEMQEDFTVEGFCNCLCVVRRKSDNVRGSLDFQHMPRYYHSFVEYPD